MDTMLLPVVILIPDLKSEISVIRIRSVTVECSWKRPIQRSIVRKIAVIVRRIFFQNLEVALPVKHLERLFEKDTSIWSVNLLPYKIMLDTEVSSIETETFCAAFGVVLVERE